jgi:hypothetical protein
MLTRFEVTFLGTLVDSEHGEEEKQGAHTKKSEAGASMRKQRRRAAVGKMIERVLHHQSPVSCFMTPFEYYHPLVHAEIIWYLDCSSYFLNIVMLNLPMAY